MDDKATDFLDRHGVMAIATVRPDGWPQATMVDYVNDGLLVYFLVSRSSEKFANMLLDDRVSIAIGEDSDDPREIRGLSIAALASETSDPLQREQAYKRLVKRHPAFASATKPDFDKAALMRARCVLVTLADYSQGLGHVDVVAVGPGGLIEMRAARPDDWGPTPSPERRQSSKG